MASSLSNPSFPGRLVNRAVWLIPASGLIGTVVYTYWMTTPDAQSDVPGFADWVTGAAAIGTGLLYVAAVSALILGLVAVYALLAGGRAGGWALAGLVAGVLGTGMILSALGTFIFAASDVAELYVGGDQGVDPALRVLSGGNFGSAITMLFNIAIGLALIGALAYGIAIWRSKQFSRWSAVAFAAGLVLFLSSTPVLAQVGGVLLAIGGVLISRSLSRRQTVSLGPQPADHQRAKAA